MRKWTESDAESLFEYAKNPNVGPIAGWPPHKSVEESKEIIKNVLNGAECYAICEKENNIAIGSVELKLNGHTDMTERDDECELGYWLAQLFWGRGYMPEAAGELLRRAFEELGMTTVWCGYYDGNAKSKRVQEKLGFVFHHTCNELPVPLLNEVRVGHTTIMTKEHWEEIYKQRIDKSVFQFSNPDRLTTYCSVGCIFGNFFPGESDMTDKLQSVTQKFVEQSWEILAENLVGIYLHGSAVMGCFNGKKSDIDLLVVVKDAPTDEKKLRFMNMAVELNALAPSKGIEFSVVKKSVCSPFVYPTPFELHFSVAHLDWFRKNPHDYVLKMHGTDKDLAAHIMIIRNRGLCLYGSEIAEVFADVGEAAYFDSIKNDIENAESDILENPVYTTLNLCRVLAYKKEKLVLSKKEGGEWGLKNLPEKYAVLIQSALDDYANGSDEPAKFDKNESAEYTEYMKKAISG